MKVKMDIVKQMNWDGISWKYSHMEINSLMNYFDVIVNYLIKENSLIINFLRYGIQGDKNLPEIIQLESSKYISDINKLENYFMLDNEFEKKVYDTLKNDLLKSEKEFEINDYSQEAYEYREYCSKHGIILNEE